jgi:hypothetical protein
MSSALLAILARGALFGTAASAISALLPVIARDQLAGGPFTYGFLLGAFGVGAVCGAYFGVRLRSTLRTEWVVRGASAGWILSAAIVAASAYAPLTMIALLLNGASVLLALSTFNVTAQLSTPRWVVARVLSLYQMCTFGAMAVGSWLWGEMTAAHGLAAALLAACAVQGACIILGLRAALPDAEGLNLDPLRQWREPETGMPIDPRSGPIVVTIEYRIAEDDVRAFLQAMAQWRRVRRRDGALDWTLLRDIADPAAWHERFRTPTWLDYLRHTTRITQADSAILARVRSFHQGPERPQVRRMIEHPSGPSPARNPVTDELP